MESYRRQNRLNCPAHRSQAGITVLGFLLLATVFGSVGLAALKVTPLYLQSLRVKTVLSDMQAEMDGKAATSNGLRNDLTSRLYVEGIRLAPDAIKISPGTNGYSVSVQYDNRARYLADIWFLVLIDEQIEIRR
jgi:hypothetical protein